ncbi:SDR family NAD(P)-dependent oxidoreductase [Nocardia arthritidis]|uniref:SDR family NAD(P)-dependent oxidoreductase n=1 Tax=Nocardia arthritidis TaxID=228602 RepID=A0A6G9YIC4_9NOCA|nr:SDR family NAD(P)-dependent oxidoreductase [Nocardia arthritidis]QIS12934.1 SDR family NAD(P)-dependent oxidoreductase [Nocardia arthritidis]
MTTRVFRLVDNDIAAYASAVGDRNPLHVDGEFGRRSPYGRPVAHGALVVTLALGALAELLDPRTVHEIRVIFRQPTLPGRRYEIDWTVSDGRARGRVRFGDIEVVDIRCVLGAALPWCGPAAVGAELRTEPRVLGLGHLISPSGGPGRERGSYAIDYRQVSGLVARVIGGWIPEHLATVLGWASYWTGMCTPGRDALLVALTMRLRGSGCGAIKFETQEPEADRGSGLVTVRARSTRGAAADITVESLIREPVPGPDPAELAAVLPPSQDLAGRTILVVGGSRGLGAAVSIGLASQGARVLVSCTRVSHPLMEAASRYTGRLVPVLADVSDGWALQTALPDTPLDGVVLLAAPAIPNLSLAPDAIEPAAQFMAASTRLVFGPLSVCAPRLRPGATVVLVSSEAVVEPPRWWPHYVAAKAALEGLAKYLAHHHHWNVVVARPPRLWTDLTNTPGGRAASHPIAPVAAEIVTAFRSEDAGTGEVSIIGPDTQPWPSVAEEVRDAGDLRARQVVW